MCLNLLYITLMLCLSILLAYYRVVLRKQSLTAMHLEVMAMPVNKEAY